MSLSNIKLLTNDWCLSSNVPEQKYLDQLDQVGSVALLRFWKIQKGFALFSKLITFLQGTIFFPLLLQILPKHFHWLVVVPGLIFCKFLYWITLFLYLYFFWHQTFQMPTIHSNGLRFVSFWVKNVPQSIPQQSHSSLVSSFLCKTQIVLSRSLEVSTF